MTSNLSIETADRASADSVITLGLNLKLNIADTASMLSPYARTQRLIDSLIAVRNSIALKLNIADTAAMLAPYATTASSTSGLNLKVNIADTASMLSPYSRTQRMIDSLTAVRNSIALKLNIADTAAMLAPYATVASSTSGLNLKLNIADTACDVKSLCNGCQFHIRIKS